MPCVLANVLDHISNYPVVLLVVNLESETFTFFHYSSAQKCCFFPNTCTPYSQRASK